MKRAQRKDFFREIWKSKNRFLSILLITALGVSFYAGIRASEPDMKMTADQRYDETYYMDVRVVGTLGLTEEDLEEIRQLPGVERIEPGMQAEAITMIREQETILQIFSIGEQINLLQVEGGRLPEASGECFMDALLLNERGLQLGDVITLESGETTEEGEQKDILDTLETDTYTIVGYGSTAEYLTWNRSTASIGDGKSDGFVALRMEEFYQDPEAVQTPIYHNIWLTVEGAGELNSYDDDYEALIDDMIARIEEIAGERCEIRYQAIHADAERQLADARQEIADAEAEIADAEQELADAAQEIADAEVELADGRQELEDGRKEIADGEKEIADAEIELADGWRELQDAKQELADGWQEYNDGLAELQEKEAELQDALKELKDGRAELDDKWAEYRDGKEAYEEGLAQYEAALAAGMPPSMEMQMQLEATEEELAAGEQALQEAEETWQDGWDQAQDGKKQIEDAWLDLADAEKKLLDGEAELADGEKELRDGEAELADAKIELEDAKLELADGEKELQDGEQELADGKAEYEEAKAEADVELADARAEIADAKIEIADAEADLAELEMPEWIVLKRSDSVQQFIEYGMDAERIGALGDVFPVIFFLVATLVCLTTMTRMVEEERTQIGTMKALGYSKGSIAAKYIWYAMSACLIGGVLGAWGGSKLYPYVIISAYKILYINTPAPVLPIHMDICIVSVLIGVGCTVLATMMSCYKELAGVPAELMRPVAPKQGKRVFLERITFLWKHLNFTWKSTLRNLFRYKKRLFMTIFGIGGSMALLMVGFGLRDSIQEIVNNQYKTLWTYDAFLSMDEDADEGQKADYEVKLMSEEELIRNAMAVRLVAMDAQHDAAIKSVEIFVPERLEDLSDFLVLQDRITKEKYRLEEGGVVVSEKLSQMLNVKVGDTFYLVQDETEKYPVTITAITENYMSHYVYLTRSTYENVFGEKPAYNQLYLKLADLNEVQKEELASHLMEEEIIQSITYVEDFQEKVSEMMKALDMVVVILILAAGLLAFVVLYNLNNISIMERRRELATLKVLGFYDIEVAEYVYRENVLLTVFGILVGIVLGRFLHQFVVLTCETDIVMFGRTIKPLSYLFSAIATVIFAMIVNFGMYFNLKKIDMVESLKSIE